MLNTVLFSDDKYAKPKEILVERLRETVSSELIRIGSEINMLAVKPVGSTADPKHNQINNVFHGQIGVVQTGPSSYAVANQQFGSVEKQEIDNALCQLLEALDESRSETTPFNIEDVRAIVIEARNESLKAQPNVTRLRGLLTTIGGAIEMAPKLREAYDALKWAGTFVGVTLP